MQLDSSTKSFTLVFPGDEIPEWFSTKSEWFSTKSDWNRVAIPVPPNLSYDANWHGVAICAAISLVGPDTEISKPFFQCTLKTDLFHMKPVVISLDESHLFRSYPHLLLIGYIPKSEIPELLNQSTRMWAKFETCNPSSWEFQKWGIRLVYEQDAQWDDKLVTKDSKNLNEVQCAILDSGWLSLVDTFWKWEPCTPPGKEDSTTILQRKTLESVLPRYFEAENYVVILKFNLSVYPGWCMYTDDDEPMCSPVSTRLPLNLHKCKKWMGIVIYASIAAKEPHTSEKDYHVYLKFKIGKYHLNASVVYIRSTDEPHQLLFVYIPRAVIIQEFAQTSPTFLDMAFTTDNPGAEVQGSGIKIVDWQEGLEKFVEAMIHCMQRSDTLKLHEKWVVERWIELVRLQGDSCTPNKRHSRTRRERKFELLSQKYRKWDWSASAFFCIFLGDEFCRKKWFMHFIEGNSAEIELPPNLLGDPNWLGIAVCAIYWRSHEDQDTPDSDSNILSWHLEFDVAQACLSASKYEVSLQKFNPQDPQEDGTFYKYVPQTSLKLRKQCGTAKATFSSSSPCLVVRRCALRLVYKEDIEDLVQSLTLCELP